MKGFVSTVLAVLAASGLVTAVPTSLAERTTSPSTSVYNIKGDPKYVTPEGTLKKAIVCPSYPRLDKKYTVLLVPGTGEPTVKFYENNFGSLLPQNGFPVCYLVIPSMSLGDAQITAEFVAYAINSLRKSIGGKVRVLSHSQGGLNMQWALTFFKSTRQNVHSFVGTVPDYKGTIVAPFANALTGITQGGARPSVLQQSFKSNHVKALAKKGGINAPFVPTTNIWTAVLDEVVAPNQLPPTASSYIPGAVNIPVQQICPTRVEGHFLIITDVITQYFALQAFSSSGGKASPATLNAVDRAKLCANILPNFSGGGGAVQFGLASLTSAIGVAVVVGGERTLVEPPVMAYAK